MTRIHRSLLLAGPSKLWIMLLHGQGEEESTPLMYSVPNFAKRNSRLCLVLVCSKHNIKVIVDLHAAPGSQNGNDHSGSRDGSQEWGQTDANIDQTVAVIDFLTARLTFLGSLLLSTIFLVKCLQLPS